MMSQNYFLPIDQRKEWSVLVYQNVNVHERRLVAYEQKNYVMKMEPNLKEGDIVRRLWVFFSFDRQVANWTGFCVK